MLIISHPDQIDLARSLSHHHGIPLAELEYRKFPDGETYLRLLTPVKDANIVIVCSLNHPDDKIMWLYLLCQTLRTEGVNSIHLIAPYLGYMRQDTQFHPGESVTSKYFAQLLSQLVDKMTTIDPHLHRYKSLSEIYTIPTTVLHAAPLVSLWISKHVKTPLLIGPDSESAQWASDLSSRLNVPFIILEKNRLGDHDVEVSIPDVHLYLDHTPILIDDIISTAHTMIETISHLKKTPLRPPICIGIHAVFSGNAFEELSQSGCSKIVTTNSITHPSNQIDISSLKFF
jgi:ribose-phosphate pyrophosphokinase